MDLGILLVGIDHWEDITLPAIQSIQHFEPNATLTVIDNASKKPYPKPYPWDIRFDERVCYSKAINVGFDSLKTDWLLSLNNDILVKDRISPVIERLDIHAVYSRQIITEKNITWFGNWSCLMHKSIWEIVGKFDENFQMCGFEDADYSIRSHALGIPTKYVPLPILHRWDSIRWQLPDYPEVRKSNMEYLQKKHGVLLGENVKVIHQ